MSKPMSPLPSPRQNLLLAALPEEDFANIVADLELVPMPLGQMLYEPGEQLTHALFPTSAIVSLLYVMKSGATTEATAVGNEGVVGISLFLGGDATSSSAVVQAAGYAYRLHRDKLMQAFNRAGAMQRLLLRYTQGLVTQMMQTTACNRHHRVEQQLCRWLLLTLDRAPTRDLIMTQELVASMLGVRPEGLAEAAGKLQHAGFIRFRRGHIAVLDRAGLETHACECYAAVKRELNRPLAAAQ